MGLASKWANNRISLKVEHHWDGLKLGHHRDGPKKKRVMDGTDLKLGHYLDWYLSGTGLNNRISLTVEHHWDGLNLGLGHWPQCLTCSSQVTAYTHMSCVRFEAIMAVHMTMAVV